MGMQGNPMDVQPAGGSPAVAGQQLAIGVPADGAPQGVAGDLLEQHQIEEAIYVIGQDAV